MVVVGSQSRRSSVRTDEDERTRSVEREGVVDVFEENVGGCSDVADELVVVVLDCGGKEVGRG